MPRKIISFDCDGVLAEGGWTPLAERTNKVYCAKKVCHPEAVATLHWLSITYDIYVISTRSHEDANLGLRAWLHFAMGLGLDDIAGVITGPSAYPKDLNENTPMNKASVVELLGSVCHIDDDPHHVRAMPGVGVLMVSEMPASKEAANLVPTIASWANLREFLTTPGHTLYGKEGGVVVSPATEEFRSRIRPEDLAELTSGLAPAPS